MIFMGEKESKGLEVMVREHAVRIKVDIDVGKGKPTRIRPLLSYDVMSAFDRVALASWENFIRRPQNMSNV